LISKYKSGQVNITKMPIFILVYVERRMQPIFLMNFWMSTYCIWKVPSPSTGISFKCSNKGSRIGLGTEGSLHAQGGPSYFKKWNPIQVVPKPEVKEMSGMLATGGQQCTGIPTSLLRNVTLAREQVQQLQLSIGH
jgi:hypothetical protein